ncbi:MAG: DUF5132 domain-containing protein [Cyanobacteria bacterium SID2]|nr:DUF5132 domain-containing protein [Cyanobacteria bacterium SID2]MBP0004689.1 DUF5132 domain-containing protein [Cyanobacteria bacterium SBC]
MDLDLDLSDFVEDVGLPGLVLGVGVLVLAPFFGSALAKVGKPLAKATIKGGLIAYEKGKVVLSEAREAFQQVLEESKAELERSEAGQAIDSVKTVSISSASVED